MHLVHRSAKVSLCTQLVQGYRYESGRCVWVGGAGGFVLHEDRPGLRDEFGKNVMWFQPGNLNQAHSQLMTALRYPAMRAEMSNTLRDIVFQKHTWQHRASTLINEIEGFLLNVQKK